MDYFHINYKEVKQENGRIVVDNREYEPIGLEIATGNFILMAPNMTDIRKYHQGVLLLEEM